MFTCFYSKFILSKLCTKFHQKCQCFIENITVNNLVSFFPSMAALTIRRERWFNSQPQALTLSTIHI